jgi:hypothetical protein
VVANRRTPQPVISAAASRYAVAVRTACTDITIGGLLKSTLIVVAAQSCPTAHDVEQHKYGEGADENHGCRIAHLGCSSDAVLDERAVNSDHYGTEAYDVQRWKETQDEREHQFDAHFAGPLFCKLPPLGP